MQDAALLEIEVVLDQGNLSVVIKGNHPNAVLNDDVFVCADEAVWTEHRVAVQRQERALVQQLSRCPYPSHAAPPEIRSVTVPWVDAHTRAPLP